MIEVVTGDAVDLRLAHRWIAGDTYWSPGIPWERFEKACHGSLCFGARTGGQQVGFARVVTDRATFAWLCDVYVAPAARGSGAGKALVAGVIAHPDLLNLRNFVLATGDAHGLYERFGFERLGEPGDRFMRIHRAAAELYGADTIRG